MKQISGYVLTGGAGRRLGRDKSSLLFGGVTLGRRAAAILEPITEVVSAVGKPVDGLAFVEDIAEGKTSNAAIFGIRSALADSPSDWTAVLACDLPFITTDFFRLLASFAKAEESEAIVPVQQDGRLQPLAAIYRTEPCRDKVETFLANGGRSMHGLVDTLAVRRVSNEEYAGLPGSERFFLNINTPGDLQVAMSSKDG